MQNIVDDLHALHRLWIQGTPQWVPWIVKVTWREPPSGWIKVNTNGATFGSLGLPGYANVFRTLRSFIKGCFCIPLGVSYAFEAELAAVIHAAMYATSFG